MSCKSYLAHYFSMPVREGVVFPSAVGKSKQSVRPGEGFGRTNAKKPTELLTK